MTTRARPVVTGILSAVALIITLAGIGLCLPFSTCPGCHGKGELRVPPSYPDHEKYTQECRTCRHTGRASFLTTRSALRSLVPCRLCGGHGEQAECSFYMGPPRPCKWCDGSGKMSPQRVQQYDLELKDRLSRFGN